MRRPGSNKVVEAFSEASAHNVLVRPATRKKAPPPFSIRFTAEERLKLDQAAGSLPLGTYIRKCLFGAETVPRKNARRKPSADDAAIAKALAALGRARLSSNLNQIAKAANQGALPVSSSLQEELNAACADIAAMRESLIAALNIQPRD